MNKEFNAQYQSSTLEGMIDDIILHLRYIGETLDVIPVMDEMEYNNK